MKDSLRQAILATLLLSSLPANAFALPRTLYELPFTPTGINNSNQVVGHVANPPSGGAGAYLYSHGRTNQLEAQAGWRVTPTDINDSGKIVGNVDWPHVFLTGAFATWQGTALAETYVGSPPGLEGVSPVARAINNLGEITGDYQPSVTGVSRRGFILSVDGSSSRELLVPEGSPDTGPVTVYDLNDSGAAAGTTATPIGWDSSGAGRYLTSGLLYGSASGINAAGAIVLTVQALPRLVPRGVLLTEEGQTVGIGALIPDIFYGSSSATGINDRRDVVGRANTLTAGVRAILFRQSTGLQDLNTLTPPGAGLTLREATKINNKAVIIGTADGGNGPVGYMLKLVASEMRPLGACARHIAAGRPVRRNTFCQFEFSVVDSRQSGIANSLFFLQLKRQNSAEFVNIGGGALGAQGTRRIMLRMRESGVYRMMGPLTHEYLPSVPSNEMLIRVN